jgi:hypothetical protein
MYTYGFLQNSIVGPEAYIKITNPVNKKSTPTRAIIDTGATITCIRSDIIEKINQTPNLLTFGNDITLLDYSGKEVKYPTCSVLLSLINNSGSLDYFERITVVVLPSRRLRNYGIIGRDVLNSRKIILDCLKEPESWSIHDA